MDGYKVFPTGDQPSSYDTTQYAGRLWTDKTVTVPTSDNQTVGTTATFNLADPEHDLDGEGDKASQGVYEVDKTASGTFLTSVSLLSSSLSTELVEPVPLDIVLVLDVSGSMADQYQRTYTARTNGSASNNSYTNYYVNTGTSQKPIYQQITGRTTVSNTYLYTTGDGKYYQYIQSNSAIADGTPNTVGTTNTIYSRHYSRGNLTGNTKMADLKTAVNEFIDTISSNNTKLYQAGYTNASMSRISLVKFATQYAGASTFDDNNPNYTIGNSTVTYQGGTYNATQIVSDLTTYTTTAIDGMSLAGSSLKTTVNGLNASGATAADYGMTLARGVLEGTGTLNGSRSEAQKVIVFFTDGEPNHGTGFTGTVANSAIGTSGILKDADTLVYSVAVLDGATSVQPTSGSSDTNRYLHAVSSNYPDATGYAYNNLGSVAEGVDFTNNNYYIAVGGGTSLSDAFSKIAADISSGGGEDSTATGRDGNTAVTITDYLGDYMEFKGLDGILYGVTADTTKFYAPGTQGAYHEQAQVQRDDASATQSTYTMWPKDLVPSALLNPEPGQENVSLNGITVKVTRSTNPKVGDTVTITVPPELIPSLRYAVEQKQEGDNITTTSTRTDADPLRIFYSIGPKASTVSSVISQLEDQSLRSESATNESDRQTTAFKNFMADAAAEGENGIYKVYSNTKTTGDQGTATVNMTLSDNNPYYFYVEEPLYVVASGSGANTVYRKATSADAALPKYVRTRYWTVGANPTEQNSYAEWSGNYGTYDSSLYTYNEATNTYTAVTSAPSEGTPLYRKFTFDGNDTYVEYSGAFDDFKADNTLYIPNGTPHTEYEVTNVSISKGDGNATSTATTSLVSTFAGEMTATQRLGNNGMLSIPVPGTLAVTKNIAAGAGFELPTDPVPSATFTLNMKSPTGAVLNQPNTYRALIRDAAGHPIDPTTHAQVSSADSAKFYVVDGSTFELRDGETLKVTNLPHGATYTVTEDGQAGYQATVTDNTGDTHTEERGESASTTPAGTGTGSGD